VLVLGGTPLHALSGRVHEFYTKIRHPGTRDPAASDTAATTVDEDTKRTQPLRRSRPRRRIGAMANGGGADDTSGGDLPYDSPVLAAKEASRRGRSAKAEKPDSDPTAVADSTPSEPGDDKGAKASA